MNFDTTNWKYVYKIDAIDGTECTTNMLYTPLMNEDGTVMCMDWNRDNPYQSQNTRLSKELSDFFFERELKNLTLCHNKPWAPKVYHVEYTNRKIFIEWNKESLSYVVHQRDIDSEIPDWKEQIFDIVKSIVDNKHYKMALYPHCFFLSKDKQIKTIDYYSMLSMEERYMPRKFIEGLVGGESLERWNKATVEDNVDFKIFFEHTLQHHLGKVWKENPFPEFYNRLFS